LLGSTIGDGPAHDSAATPGTRQCLNGTARIRADTCLRDLAAGAAEGPSRTRKSTSEQKPVNGNFYRGYLLPLALLTPSAAVAAPLPQPVADMIKAVRGDKAALEAVVAAARKTNPQSSEEIDALLASIAAEDAREREQRLASQRFLEGWSSEGQAGAFGSTGNTSEVGVTLGLSVAKETRLWRHRIDSIIEWQRSAGNTTKERFELKYDGNRKLGEKLYVWLSLSAERDTFAGFTARFTEGVGVGYRVLELPLLAVDLEAGPALRQTNFIGAPNESSLAGRFAARLRWDVRPDIAVTQSLVTVIESASSTLTSKSALTTRLTDALSARASFDVRHETEPQIGRRSTDTSTRFTLVYGF
jgi:putative salt-induced outer membrane protein